MASLIETCAINYINARLEAEALRIARNKTSCTAENHRGQPCWVATEDTLEANPIARSSWCPSCNRGQVLHDQYHEAANKRGACYRMLKRAVVAKEVD